MHHHTLAEEQKNKVARKQTAQVKYKWQVNVLSYTPPLVLQYRRM